MNIAPRVMATMRTVVKIDAMTIFIRFARRTKTADGRIAQLGEKQNAQRGGMGAWNFTVNAYRLQASTSKSSASASKLSVNQTNRQRRVSSRSDSRDHTLRSQVGQQRAVRNESALRVQ